MVLAKSTYQAQLWTLQGEMVASFAHNDVMVSAEFSPDGQQILTSLPMVRSNYGIRKEN